jgi:hypothetical protein
MSSDRAWSTSRSSATDAGRSAPRRRWTAPLVVVLVAALAGGLLAPAEAAPNRAAAKRARKSPLLTFFSESTGERSAEASGLKFAFFQTLYRHTRAPRSESPTGERIEVVQKRKECDCLRLADYTRIKFQLIRQIDITYPEGARVALVRITRRDGKIREYDATALYGGDGLFPPRFAATVDGEHREFPLVLPDTPAAAWPEERVVRMIVYRTDPLPPPKKKKAEDESR